MDFLNWIKNNPISAIAIPSAVSTLKFLANLAIALSDGQLDANELNTLLTAADGFQTAILAAILVVLKFKKN